MRKILSALIECCLIFLIIFTPLVYGAVQPGSIAVFETVAALMGVFWIVRMLIDRKLVFSYTPLTIFIILAICYTFFQLVLPEGDFWPCSVYRYATRTELLKLISYAIIFFVTVNTIKTRQQIARMLAVIVCMGFMGSVFFLLRYFNIQGPQVLYNPDHFSAYLGMIIPASLGVLFSTEKENRRSTARILILFAIVLMTAALFFTMSRGGIISFILTFIFMIVFAMTRKTLRKKILMLSLCSGFIILTLLWLGITPIIERLLSIKVEVADLYFAGRFPIWQGTIDIIRRHPFFGTGLGTFEYVFPAYQPPELWQYYSHAHSDYLELISVTGIAGFGIAVIALTLFIRFIYRNFYDRHNHFVVCTSFGIIGSVVCFFIHEFFDFNFYVPANAILITIFIALSISILGYKREFNGVIIPLRFSRFLLIPVVIIVAVLFSVAVLKPAFANYYFVIAQKETGLPEIGKQGLLRKAIELDSDNAHYYYELGRELAKNSLTLAEGVRYLEKSSILNPENGRYHQSLGWAYGSLADLSEKRDDIKQAMVLREKAVKQFHQAIALNPGNPYRYRTYALWLLKRPSIERRELKKIVKKMIVLKPELAHDAFDRYYHATADYNQLREIVPDTLEGYVALRDYYTANNLNDLADAEKKRILALIYKLLQGNETIKVYTKIGQLYNYLGMFNDSIRVYHKAIDSGAEDTWVFFRLADSYEKAGNDEEAIRYFKDSIKADRKNSWAYSRLAKLYKRLGNLKEARVFWEKILTMRDADYDTVRIANRELEKIENMKKNNSEDKVERDR